LLMQATAVIAALFLSMTAGVFFAIGTFYLYLMYKEFYLGKWLSDRPLLYAITHQLITVPMVGFAFTAFAPQSYQSSSFIWFSVLLVSAFFAFEVGRKLDPKAHPLLKTYLSIYGKAKTAAIIVIMLVLLCFSAYQLGLWSIIPLAAVTMASLVLMWTAPERFKWIEGLMMFLLLYSLWGVPLKGMLT